MIHEKKVVLKSGREKSLLNRHPWIFSGAVASFPSFQNGEILPVHSAAGEFLAKAYFHTENSISGRVLTFLDEPITQAVTGRLVESIQFRKSLFDPAVTNCYRLVNAEGDGLAGLVIDIYDDIAVVQISTHGMESLKPLIIQILTSHFSLRGIYEKSQSTARRQEGLANSSGLLFGECPKEVIVKENGVLFVVDIEGGQKTGLFLDQRQMRHLVQTLSSNRRVLNCFAYTAGFSLFALKGGASSVTSVDMSRQACHYARENSLLNHLSAPQHEIVCENVFDYLKRDVLPFDFIILDPPAFAKKKQDVNEACRGYKEINRQCLQKMPPNSYLLTCSCSHFVDENLFGQVVFQAAIEAKREAVICSRHIQALDHPVSLFHPEGSYLKSLLLYVK